MRIGACFHALTDEPLTNRKPSKTRGNHSSSLSTAMPAPTLALALVEIETHRGVSAAELLARRADSQRWISASALERWLVESGFAETNGEPGRLVPTQLAIEVGGLLFPSDRVVRLGRDLKVSRWLVCPNPSNSLPAPARGSSGPAGSRASRSKVSDPRTIERVAAIFREGRAKRPRA
jgi:hypothetical protein